MANKFDIHQHITDGIIKALKEGTPPWQKPWTGGKTSLGMPTRSTGEYYRGINMIWLWLTADQQGYISQHWFTYKQAQELGAQVRKGEKSTRVVYYSTIEREDDNGNEQFIPFTKSYAAFNADQIDGLPEHFYVEPDPPRDLGTRADPYLDECFAKTGAKLITTDEPRAYYHRVEDYIHMPPVHTFYDRQKYYGTLYHELTHWSGAKNRLDRDKGNTKIQYAFEELVAEIGACMICARLNIKPDLPQSASYIEGWIQCLQEDKKAIFKAASLAQKAMDYIFDLIDQEEQSAA